MELQRRKPIGGQSHLEAAFAYVLRQDDHHGIEVDVYQDTSAVLDMLGLRALAPEVPTRVREHLPRLPRSALLRHLGVAELGEAVHLDHLAEAAAAAFGIDRLERDGASARARRAAVAAATGSGTTRIATALGITPQAACRLARGPAVARDVRAVRLQMALRGSRASSEEFAGEAPPRA